MGKHQSYKEIKLNHVRPSARSPTSAYAVLGQTFCKPNRPKTAYMNKSLNEIFKGIIQKRAEEKGEPTVISLVML